MLVEYSGSCSTGSCAAVGVRVGIWLSLSIGCVSWNCPNAKFTYLAKAVPLSVQLALDCRVSSLGFRRRVYGFRNSGFRV